MAYRVVITDFVVDGLEEERRVLEGVAEVEALGATSEGELAGRIEDADAVMVYHELGVGRQTIERLRRCRLMVRCGVGIDNVDHAFAAERGIPVANVPDYGTEDVADSALGLALALMRGIATTNSLLRRGMGSWSYTEVAPLRRLRGRVFGIVGLGRIGTAAALRAKAFGMDVVFFDPYQASGAEKSLGIRRAETLAELLPQCAVLSLHCPLTEETRHLIDGEALRLLPPGAYLVNTSRGAVVDTAAVPEAISSGQLAGAGIDVLEREPPDADDSLVRAWRDPGHAAHDRVIINPHLAFYSEEGLLEMRRRGAEACRRALLGLRVENVVNGVASGGGVRGLGNPL